MPQITKGGKFVFGWSVVRSNGQVRLPDMAAEEYNIASEGKVVLFTGSAKTGGFCVTRHGLLQESPLGVLPDNPDLASYERPEGHFVSYKGRKYCWLTISEDRTLTLTEEMLKILDIGPGTRLLSIRGSCYAFVMGAKGPLLERANRYEGEVDCFV
ncbi:hypothetical protein [Paenibacillus donghaensis]|uniref:Uncharacterized protein n=1 Tax=Paenibacillus donghaensis TaxID=414771 RepID=A0A2Z2K6Z6_9BACL|nr:hypothetical protein [Paenibacillus donghaensis]ASA20744.1 hypothetical protein B9T62_08060 [Paenibacillus donghaensis]